MWVWVTVTYFPDTATGYNNSVPPSQCSKLPRNILSVCCIAELFVTFPYFNRIIYCPDVIPDPSGKPQDPTLQNIGIHFWQHGNAVHWILPTALVFQLCVHFSTLIADTPSGLTWNRRAGLRSLCSLCSYDIKDQAWVTCQTDLQQAMRVVQVQSLNSGL